MELLPSSIINTKSNIVYIYIYIYTRVWGGAESKME